MSTTKIKYDTKLGLYDCEEHGLQPIGYLDCTGLYCEDGFIDMHEEDPINMDPGTYYKCPECKGESVRIVCSKCCKDNPDMRL